MNIIPEPPTIIAHLDQFLVGQKVAKTRLATAVYEHYYTLARDGTTAPKNNLLLVGPTGSGKTYLIEKTAETLGVHVHIVDAATLTPEGYTGEHFYDSLKQLLQQCGNNRERAETAIVFLDELDKLKSSETSQKENLGRMVQQQLLASLVASRVGDLSTENMLFIGAGAFVGLTDLVRARLGKPFLTENEALQLVTPSDFSQWGIIPELLGRFAIRLNIEKLGKPEFLKLVMSSKNQVLNRKKQLFAENGLELVITEDAMVAFAEKAYNENIGVRGLQAAVCEACDSVQSRFEELYKADTRRVEITADVITKKADPRFVKSSQELSSAKSEKVKGQLEQYCRRISLEGVKEGVSAKPPPQSSDPVNEFTFPLFPSVPTSALSEDERRALDKLMEPQAPPINLRDKAIMWLALAHKSIGSVFNWFRTPSLSSAFVFALLVFATVISLGYSDQIYSLTEFYELATARYTQSFWHLGALSVALCTFALKRFSIGVRATVSIVLSHLGLLIYCGLVAVGARHDVMELRHWTLSWLRLLDHLLCRDGYVSSWNFLGGAIWIFFVLVPPGTFAAERWTPTEIVRNLQRRWGRGPTEEEDTLS
jgi:ATP-dependent Clp protease ATP-binding subunit ClpX